MKTVAGSASAPTSSSRSFPEASELWKTNVASNAMPKPSTAASRMMIPLLTRMTAPGRTTDQRPDCRKRQSDAPRLE